MALNQALVACATAAKVLDTFDLALEDGVEASTVNIVTAIHRVAKTLSPVKDALAMRSDPSALKRVVEAARARLRSDASSFDARSLANLAWGLARLSSASLDRPPQSIIAPPPPPPPPVATPLVLKRPVSRGGEAAPEAAPEADGVGEGGGDKGVIVRPGNGLELTEALEEVLGVLVERDCSQMPPQALCNAAWAAAKVEVGPGIALQTLDAVLDQAAASPSRCRDWYPQDLSNLLWACGTLRHSRVGLLPAVAAQAAKLGLEAFSSQALANSLWGVARLSSTLDQSEGGFGGEGTCAEKLCADVVEEVARRELVGFRSQEVANLLWAVTVIQGSVSPSLSAALATWLSSNTLRQPQELSIGVWAIAQAGESGAAALHSLLAEAADRVVRSPSGAQDFSPQAVANLVWGLGRAAPSVSPLVVHPMLLALEREVCARGIAAFQPREVAALAWGFARIPSPAGNDLWPLLLDLAHQGGLKAFQSRQLVCLAWASAARARLVSTLGASSLDADRAQQEEMDWGGENEDEESDSDSEDEEEEYEWEEEPIQDELVGGEEPGWGASLGGVHRRTAPKQRIDSTSSTVLVQGLAVLEALARIPHGSHFSPQELSIIAWSTAVCDRYNIAVPVALRNVLLSLAPAPRPLGAYSSTALVNLVWAFAHFLQGESELGTPVVSLIEEELVRRGLGALQPHQLSNLLWALSKTGYADALAFPAASRLLLGEPSDVEHGTAGMTLRELSEQSLAMTLWAFATVDRASPPLLSAMEAELLDRGLGEFHDAEINAAIFAFSKTKHGNTAPIWDAIDEEAARRAQNHLGAGAGERTREGAGLQAAAARRGASWESAELGSLGADYHQPSGLEQIDDY